jgi:DNA-binding transcriptional regulator YiaG
MTATDIRAMRHLLGLTQRALGAALGVSYRTVQNWEAGINTPPPYVWAALRLLRPPIAPHDTSDTSNPSE